MIKTPAKSVKPRRFDLLLTIKGQTWRKVQIEISPPEGNATEAFGLFSAPKMEAFGIPTPEHLVGISLSYQIAQKIHGATDPHDPPEFVNRRARDVVDLLLLKELVEETNAPNEDEIRMAIAGIFESRAREARVLGRPERAQPTHIETYPHWVDDYAEAASGSSVELSMDEAIEVVNRWLADLGVENAK